MRPSSSSSTGGAAAGALLPILLSAAAALALAPALAAGVAVAELLRRGGLRFTWLLAPAALSPLPCPGCSPPDSLPASCSRSAPGSRAFSPRTARPD